MLEHGDQVQELVKTVGPLKCEIELPASWKDYFEKTGPLPARLDDRRRYPRYYLRVCAALQYCQTLPALPRPPTWHKILTRDMSRCGLSFLHSEVLYPRERVRVVLPGEGIGTVEIVRCTRIQRRCFETGARFVQGFQKSTA
ncbi:MAG: hypothetical protein JSW71_08165 [Gemmatimonadota bacterium]|nr:MAG: hypothetical protein JSW71_08165 [Gemmatimonadota bacterium]